MIIEDFTYIKARLEELAKEKPEAAPLPTEDTSITHSELDALYGIQMGGLMDYLG